MVTVFQHIALCILLLCIHTYIVVYIIFCILRCFYEIIVKYRHLGLSDLSVKSMRPGMSDNILHLYTGIINKTHRGFEAGSYFCLSLYSVLHRGALWNLATE